MLSTGLESIIFFFISFFSFHFTRIMQNAILQLNILPKHTLQLTFIGSQAVSTKANLSIPLKTSLKIKKLPQYLEVESYIPVDTYLQEKLCDYETCAAQHNTSPSTPFPTISLCFSAERLTRTRSKFRGDSFPSLQKSPSCYILYYLFVYKFQLWWCFFLPFNSFVSMSQCSIFKHLLVTFLSSQGNFHPCYFLSHSDTSYNYLCI